jgi:hypothetical protein
LYTLIIYGNISLEGGIKLSIYYNVKYSGVDYNADTKEIRICPICNHAISPIFLDGHAFDTDSNPHISLHFSCAACNNSFVAQYISYMPDYINRAFRMNTLDYIAPVHFIPENFTEIIKNTSESFVKIYNQALNAETMNLKEIAGIGYRKSLEFLIKDFLIKRNPDKKDSIEKTPLGTCIKSYMDNPQLEIVASRATWLGNDQTHYIKKFTENDTEDLKRLIRLTVHWISMILETEAAATIEPRK